MGKYMKKGKIKRKVLAMEISIGVRTRARAKTLALKNSKKSTSKKLKSSASSNSSSSNSSNSPSCYLQLRNRRLERCLELKNSKDGNPRTGNPRTGNPKIASNSCSNESRKSLKMGIEGSFGENFVEFEARSCSNSRETTPCSLIRRDPEIIRTPASTTRLRSTTASNRMNQRVTQRNIPATHEMEEFFAVPEERQQKEFVEKYNFDPVKDCPIPGRYEWIKLRN